MKKVYLFSIIIILFFCKCKNSQIAIDTEEEKVPITTPASTGEPKILFVNYKINNNLTANKIEAALINKIITAGKLKRAPQSIPSENGAFKFTLLDASQKELKSLNIANPLVRDVEYVQSDGLLAKKRVTLDSATISIRIQLPINSKVAQLEQIGAATSPLIKSQIVN